MERIETPDGVPVYVDASEGDRGSNAPFYVVYGTRDRDERWGWYCSHCDSLETAMDTMGRIKCTRCGNVRKPTEWDAAHE